MTSEAREELAKRIVNRVVGVPRMAPHPDLVTKVVKLLKDAGVGPT
jgi:hypothetical protein